jgi:co-chaperonin GroES (HSP10)
MSTITKFAMAHEKDPADVIREEVGDLSKIDVFHNQILVGIYRRPEKTAGGIIITQRSADEEKFQGVVGLVLKVGPTAFKDDAHNQFCGQSVEPGQWLVYRTSDTHKVAINGVTCRLLEDAHVKLRVAHPDQVL